MNRNRAASEYRTDLNIKSKLMNDMEKIAKGKAIHELHRIIKKRGGITCTSTAAHYTRTVQIYAV